MAELITTETVRGIPRLECREVGQIRMVSFYEYFTFLMHLAPNQLSDPVLRTAAQPPFLGSDGRNSRRSQAGSPVDSMSSVQRASKYHFRSWKLSFYDPEGQDHSQSFLFTAQTW